MIKIRENKKLLYFSSKKDIKYNDIV